MTALDPKIFETVPPATDGASDTHRFVRALAALEAWEKESQYIDKSIPRSERIKSLIVDLILLKRDAEHEELLDAAEIAGILTSRSTRL